jgi:thiol-disulfide isomerase/thioredoxin
MKKALLTFLLLLSVVCTLFAQNTSRLPGEDAVVKDSSGVRIPYMVWKTMLASRQYSIKGTGRRPEGSTQQEYLLYKITDAQKDAMAARMPKPNESEQFKVGDAFRPFNERDINGEKFDLKKMTGKVFVINFWFINCPPCRKEIPDLNQVVDHYKDNKDVVFIAIALDEAYAIKDFTQTTPYKYHIIDNGRYLADKYGVHLYPTNLVVNKEGKIAFSSVSFNMSNPYWLKKTIDEALKVSENKTAANN